MKFLAAIFLVFISIGAFCQTNRVSAKSRLIPPPYTDTTTANSTGAKESYNIIYLTGKDSLAFRNAANTKWTILSTGATGSGGTDSLAYTASIPFNKPNNVMVKTVTSAITFTPNTTGAIPGGGTLLSLQADGVNTPVFSGMYKLSASDVYNNTAGRKHLISFLKEPAGDYVYSISQIRTIDVTAPSISARYTIGDTSIVYSFNEPVTGSLTGYSFKKNGSALTPTSVSGSGTSTFTFKVPSFGPSDTLLGSYSSGTTVDTVSNPLASFTDTAITNSQAYAFLNFTTAVSLTNTSNNWISSAGGGAGTYNAKGLASVHFASGADGVVLMQYNGTSNMDALLGLNTTNANDGYAGYETYIQVSTTNASASGGGGAVAKVVGNWYGYKRTAGVITFVTSADNGATFTTIGTVTAFSGSTGNLYIGINPDFGKQVDKPKGSGLVP